MNPLNPYETLGVNKDASPDDIKKAYRVKAKASHPDNSGRTEHFLAVQRAYETLGDEESRARYDETGAMSGQKTMFERALEELKGLAVQVAENGDIYGQDLVSVMRAMIRERLKALNGSQGNLNTKAAKLEHAAKRFRAKDGKANFLAKAITERAEDARRQAEMFGGQVKQTEMCLEMLEDYTYAFEAVNANPVMTNLTGLAFNVWSR